MHVLMFSGKKIKKPGKRQILGLVTYMLKGQDLENFNCLICDMTKYSCCKRGSMFNIRISAGKFWKTFHTDSILLYFQDILYDSIKLTLSWLLLLSCYLSNPILIFVLDLYIWHLPWSRSQEILMETSKKRKHENEEQIESSSITGSSIMVNFIIKVFCFQW